MLFRTEVLLWTCLSHRQKLTNSLTNVFCFVFLIISLIIKVLELTLCNMKYFYAKFVHVWCIFFLSLTRLVSHWYSLFIFWNISQEYSFSRKYHLIFVLLFEISFIITVFAWNVVLIIKEEKNVSLCKFSY